MKNLVTVFVLSLLSTAALADDPVVAQPLPVPTAFPTVKTTNCGTLGFVVSSAAAVKGFLETSDGPIAFDGTGVQEDDGLFSKEVYAVSAADGKTGTLTVVHHISSCGRGSCRGPNFKTTSALLTLNGEKFNAYGCH
jgi:hypothetical protein